ncbi:hypothetical protein E2I00_019398, partial [Balaenoptera physalus]
ITALLDHAAGGQKQKGTLTEAWYIAHSSQERSDKAGLMRKELGTENKNKYKYKEVEDHWEEAIMESYLIHNLPYLGFESHIKHSICFIKDKGFQTSFQIRALPYFLQIEGNKPSIPGAVSVTRITQNDVNGCGWREAKRRESSAMSNRRFALTQTEGDQTALSPGARPSGGSISTLSLGGHWENYRKTIPSFRHYAPESKKSSDLVPEAFQQDKSQCCSVSETKLLVQHLKCILHMAKYFERSDNQEKTKPVVKIIARVIFDSNGTLSIELDLYTGRVSSVKRSAGLCDALGCRGQKTSSMGIGISKTAEHINKTLSAGYTQKGVSLYCHIADLAGNSEVILLVLSFSDFTVLLIHALNFEKAMGIGAEAYHTLKNRMLLERLTVRDEVLIGMDSEFFESAMSDIEFNSLVNLADTTDLIFKNGTVQVISAYQVESKPFSLGFRSFSRPKSIAGAVVHSGASEGTVQTKKTKGREKILEVALWMDNIVTKICSQEKAIRAPSEELDADRWEGGRVRNWKMLAHKAMALKLQLHRDRSINFVIDHLRQGTAPTKNTFEALDFDSYQQFVSSKCQSENYEFGKLARVTCEVLWVSLAAALDQANVSRVWFLLPLATTIRPVASRPLAVVPPGRLEARPLKLPGADIIFFMAPVQGPEISYGTTDEILVLYVLSLRTLSPPPTIHAKKEV